MSEEIHGRIPGKLCEFGKNAPETPNIITCEHVQPPVKFFGMTLKRRTFRSIDVTSPCQANSRGRSYCRSPQIPPHVGRSYIHESGRSTYIPLGSCSFEALFPIFLFHFCLIRLFQTTQHIEKRFFIAKNGRAVRIVRLSEFVQIELAGV